MSNDMRQVRLVDDSSTAASGPVECLGLRFASDAARRAHFSELLRAKLQEPAFRQIEGFPIGSDEDILALSDPPYYTACPNPFLEDFIRCYGTPYDAASDSYRREPFAADVSEGKNDPIYNAHSYHTKVPHKAIMRYILHYTEPGDLVFDGFCGTGMTGVAAQLCGDRKQVEALGYQIKPDGTILDEKGVAISKLGARRAILNDLSPAATFIAYNYNTPVDVQAFEREAKRILAEVEAECGWMYETLHTDGKTKGRINYTVWSDVFVCPTCGHEIVFWEAAVDKKQGKVNDEFPCPHCRSLLTKRSMERAWVTKYDRPLQTTIRQAKQVPVLINYSVGKNRHEKAPDAADLALIERIDQTAIPHWFPTDRMPEGDESRRNDDIGLTHVHHFYSMRSLRALSALYHSASKAPAGLRNICRFFVQYACLGFSRIARYVPTHFSQVNQYLSGTLYVGSQVVEISPAYILGTKQERLRRQLPATRRLSATETSDLGQHRLPEMGIDYVFTDPPFGKNLMYAELSYLWESWLGVVTEPSQEAVQNESRGKDLAGYQTLMSECFQAYYSVLKPNRWMTVEFHNSKNSVWTAIQEALTLAGFIVADVRTLDKQHNTFKQLNTAGAVKQDLVISAYKPSRELERRFALEAGTEAGAWDFVTAHLRQLPVFVATAGTVEIITERQNYLLFDRMVAFHVQRGITVPLSAAEFYQGLAQRFPERDGMYFLSEQAVEYDKKRLTVSEVEQLSLIVTDESSAIQWLRQQLSAKPQTSGNLTPQFMQEIAAWQKHETLLDMGQLLEQNFIRYDGKGEVPSQIHSYLSSNYHDLRKLAKDDPVLRAEAKDRWYVPDTNKQADLEKLREKELLKEFEEYRQSKKKLKQFRIEAVRAGFRHAYQEKDYQTILEVAEKLPESVLQEDAKLLMFYDQAATRLEQ